MWGFSIEKLFVKKNIFPPQLSNTFPFDFHTFYHYLLIIVLVTLSTLFKCRENLEIYSAELEKLTIKIIELMANALAINPKEITELFNIGI